MSNALTRHIGIAARPLVFVVAGALSLWSAPAHAQGAPERLTDDEVKVLFDRVDDTRDKFEGNLAGDLKDSILRRPTGEAVKVSAALDDYQDNVQKMKERFTDDYSASAEVTTLLRQATGFDTFLKTTPTVTTGRSEFERHAAELKLLATVYGTTFPLPANAAGRRMNDKEASEVAKNVKEAAERVKGEFDKVPAASLPDTDKSVVQKDLDMIVKQAEAVESRVDDHKPATAEVRQLVSQVAVVQRFVTAHPTQSVTPNWDAVMTGSMKLQQAFGLTK